MDKSLDNRELVITEIYPSIQGESSFAGRPCSFIRLTGCPLRCRWCDTAYGFAGGTKYSVESVVQEIKSLGINLVEITGGEPLAQENCLLLMQALIDEEFEVICETSGSECIETVPEGVTLIMDLKCPGSGMVEKNLWKNIEYLKPKDEIKFVIADRADFDWTVDICHEYQLLARHQVLVSVAFGQLNPATLVEWILESELPLRLNLQQHKYIWSPRKKGV
ncbi:MAG: radical SAM protein [Pseudobacteriovorax sp.]|nr:radical SAM protein [Pseudobacteriovorax sp.]